MHNICVLDEKINELVGEVQSTVVKKGQAEVSRYHLLSTYSIGFGARGNREPLKVLEQKSDLVNELF